MKSKSILFILVLFFASSSSIELNAAPLDNRASNVLIDPDTPTKFQRTYIRKTHAQHQPVSHRALLDELEQRGDIPTNFYQTKNQSDFLVEQSEFETHLSLGMTRTAQSIQEEDSETGIPMNVGGLGDNQVWYLPDFTAYTTYQTVQMESVNPENTPYHDAYPDATHAFNVADSTTYAYYRIGNVMPPTGNLLRDVVYHYGNVDEDFITEWQLVHSPTPLQVVTQPFGGNIIYNCADFVEGTCPEGAVTFEQQQTIRTRATGMLHLFDEENPVMAIKAQHEEEYYYYDENHNEVDSEYYRTMMWYSEEGHYIVAGVNPSAPWTGETSFYYIDYQKIEQSNLSAQWLDFIASVNDQQQVALTWQTATEQDNSHFVIQKSSDGQTFTKIGEQASKGNSTTIQSYNFTDKKPITGTNYYRIQQVDTNGKSTFSEVITAIISDDDVAAPTVVLYPNPGKNEVWFSQAADYELYNAKGGLLTSGRADGVVDVSGLPTGTYFVKINGGKMLPWMKQ